MIKKLLIGLVVPFWIMPTPGVPLGMPVAENAAFVVLVYSDDRESSRIPMSIVQSFFGSLMPRIEPNKVE